MSFIFTLQVSFAILLNMGVHEDILMLEMKLHKLKVDYDQYFCKILKIPPFKLQEEIKRIIRKYSNVKIQNSGIAFKYKSLVGRYTSYDNLWKRSLREIDEGTFKRGRRGATTAPRKEAIVTADESQAEKLYKEFISAKSSLNEKTDNIKVSMLEKIIEKQTNQIKAKYKCDKVDYKVVTENGQAKIKAIPKK